MLSSFFFFNDTATTEIYTLSLHDALPISRVATHQMIVGIDNFQRDGFARCGAQIVIEDGTVGWILSRRNIRSEEHTSELQSHLNLVCRLLLEKKKQKITAVLDS